LVYEWLRNVAGGGGHNDGFPLFLRRYKQVARDLTQGGQNAGVANAASFDLFANHLFPRSLVFIRGCLRRHGERSTVHLARRGCRGKELEDERQESHPEG
jgi:hypothetical protein